jgi:YVTN family beta-propeller protein
MASKQNEVRRVLSKSFYLLAAASFCIVVSSGQAQMVKGTIHFSHPTAGVGVDPVANRIYVVAPSFGGATDSLSVIDGKTNRIINNIAIPVGAYLPAVNYPAGKVYVATCNSEVDPVACSVTVVDAVKGTVAGTIPITSTEGDGLLGIAVNTQTNRIYVANASDQVVDVIDGRTDKVTATLAVSGGGPIGLVTNSFSNLLYVPLGNASIDLFDTRSNALTSTSAVGSAATFAAVNTLSGNVFVTDSVAGASTTEVLDKNGTSIASVPVGDTPYGVDLDPITNLVFVASTALDNITVINGKTNTVKATVPHVPGSFVAVNFVTQQVYVSGSNIVTVLTEK